MIPMAALGIPGDSTTALLIGALTIHGLEMGPMVFKNSGNVVYLMFATVMVCALVVLVLQALGMRVFPLILKVPYHYMYPALIIISFVSAYVDSSSLYKCGMMLVFVCIGILMSYGGLPTAPLILAYLREQYVKVVPVFRKCGCLLHPADFLCADDYWNPLHFLTPAADGDGKDEGKERRLIRDVISMQPGN